VTVKAETARWRKPWTCQTSLLLSTACSKTAKGKEGGIKENPICLPVRGETEEGQGVPWCESRGISGGERKIGSG